ncbi:MAG: hypothetical protein KatS3mg105_2993 [Gemmatales bacterium]|nr:MAG: hypothetical protein KatS3mg105_2993 [Gemmatales bacterium]
MERRRPAWPRTWYFALCLFLLCSGRTVASEEKGIIFVMEGVGGGDMLTPWCKLALPRAGVPYAIRQFKWTHGRGRILADLQDTEHLRRKAVELAEEVRRYRTNYPEAPIFFIAKSGGTGLALAAAELLPPATLERIILLSAAVSPYYDLTKALRATRFEIVSFYSRADHLVLGWGTRHFGTIDRQYVPSAGLVGFAIPPELRQVPPYNRLVEIAWTPDMILQGHFGRHFGTSAPCFLGKHVAPWLHSRPR